MSKLSIKIVALSFVSIVLALIYSAKSIDDLLGYLILSVLVLQGVMAICDFVLGLPMTVAYARLMEPTERNKVGRIVFLIIAIILMIFAFWWILFDEQLVKSLLKTM